MGAKVRGDRTKVAFFSYFLSSSHLWLKRKKHHLIFFGRSPMSPVTLDVGLKFFSSFVGRYYLGSISSTKEMKRRDMRLEKWRRRRRRRRRRKRHNPHPPLPSNFSLLLPPTGAFPLSFPPLHSPIFRIHITDKRKASLTLCCVWGKSCFVPQWKNHQLDTVEKLLEKKGVWGKQNQHQQHFGPRCSQVSSSSGSPGLISIGKKTLLATDL